jgi:hypothetical protein
MRFPHTRGYLLFDVITIITAVLLASVFLLLGVINLISPDVDSSALGQNTRVCITLIVAGAVLIYALFRPYAGGFLVCISAVPFPFVFHFQSFWAAVAGLVLLVGVLFVIRGRLSRRTASQDAEQGS